MHEDCTSSIDSCTGHFAAAAGPAQNYCYFITSPNKIMKDDKPMQLG
jgi:hypothetical protein